MLGLMGFSGSLPLYVIHRYYIFVFIDRANKDACLLPCPGTDILAQVPTIGMNICMIWYYIIVWGDAPGDPQVRNFGPNFVHLTANISKTERYMPIRS